WTGSNDGVVSLTRDGGKTWANVTPASLPKGGRVESIEPSQYNPAKAYIAVDFHLLGDDRPYVYKTSDYGASWQLLSNGNNGIPSDFPTRVLREDPEREGLLYAGTEYGVFVSFNDGVTWQKFQQNLPVTPITDLKIFRGDLIISTMGRGFWILDNITALRQQAINSLSTVPVLFKPDTTIRYRYPTVRGISNLQYPQTAVTLDYYIPKNYKGSVQLEIMNENRRPITTILSDSTLLKAFDRAIHNDVETEVEEEIEVEEQEGVSEVTEVENMQLSQIFRYTDERLSSKPGLHRFNWNLRQRGVWDKDIKRRYQRGPMVAPGTYIAKLTVAGQTLEHTFEIVPDPRITQQGFTQQDMGEQLAFQNKVLELLSEAKQLQADLETQ
ncbi:MAG: hypothetical protein KAG66_21950, partial [Methylococcales bacterium]|nr:hypothetical protein [Methylococcales bacterium]